MHYRLDDDHVRTVLDLTREHLAHRELGLMGAGHDHGAAQLSAGGRHQGRLLLALGIIGAFFVVEVVVGIAANSLALLSDAGHMFTDVIGLGMSLAAIRLAARHDTETAASTGNTFGLYRLEILAAFVNALLLFGVAIWVLVEAVRRLFAPAEVLGVPMFVVAVAGLVANVVAFWLLRAAPRSRSTSRARPSRCSPTRSARSA